MTREDREMPNGKEWGCWTNCAVFAIVAGTAVVEAVKFGLIAAGFTAGGIVAGSLAAGIQSTFYGGFVGSTSIFAALQSAGAAGIGMKAILAIYAIVGGTYTYVKSWVFPCYYAEPSCSSDRK